MTTTNTLAGVNNSITSGTTATTGSREFDHIVFEFNRP